MDPSGCESIKFQMNNMLAKLKEDMQVRINTEFKLLREKIKPNPNNTMANLVLEQIKSENQKYSVDSGFGEPRSSHSTSLQQTSSVTEMPMDVQMQEPVDKLPESINNSMLESPITSKQNNISGRKLVRSNSTLIARFFRPSDNVLSAQGSPLVVSRCYAPPGIEQNCANWNIQLVDSRVITLTSKSTEQYYDEALHLFGSDGITMQMLHLLDDVICDFRE